MAGEPIELTELVRTPSAGRVFERLLRPGIADVDPEGRARLDAIARWLQDIAYADVVDAGFEDRGFWVVRRTRVRVSAFPAFGEGEAMIVRSRGATWIVAAGGEVHASIVVAERPRARRA